MIGALDLHRRLPVWYYGQTRSRTAVLCVFHGQRADGCFLGCLAGVGAWYWPACVKRLWIIAEAGT